MAEIQVPVKLLILNLQSLVTELLNKLSNLKVGSTGFKNILNIIQSIRGEIDKLSVLTAKPFVDASLFTKAERSVDKLEDLITKVSIAISRLKFGDLELTDAQKADIKGFEDSINNIKDKIKTVKDAAKEAFLKTEVGLEWLSINPEAATKSLSQITGAIEREVDKLRQELDKLKASAADYLKAIDLNNRVREFLDKSGDNPLSKLNLGEQYDKIFQTTAKNLLRYTPSGRNLLADWLSSLLKLDDSTISQIVNKNITAANVTGKLKEVLSSLLTADKDLHAKLDANNVALLEKLALYNLLATTLNAAAAAQLGITVAEQVARAELANTEAAAASYKDRLVDIARSGANVQSTTNAMKSQLEGFRTTLEQASGSFLRLLRTQLSFNQMKMAVVNFMGFNQVLNLTKRAVREAVNHIKELDTVMNKISIVTDMSTGDLWNQVAQYSEMAQAYGTTIKGAYEVSQIYYQLGLETNDVLTLTNETLKLAKVSGLDYATTTDYMTTALRGFKMEMSEASTVVDVYSNLAAHTAVSSEELAVAMSKTASSMESVGSTFEETSAMIGTMVAVTRESAVNIGSALKSIAARYGEMKKDPLSIIDSEGEEVSFNKVDAALQSVGISLKTTDGQFRSFTDVILELSEKWDQLESTQQRYIATLFAGNRQQSRFLALVSNKDLLKANIGFAEESEDTGTLQALKALDSIESKLNLVQVAYQLFYTSIGAENIWKGFLDGARNVINTLNSFPKLFGKIPVGAIAAISSIVSVLKTLGIKALSGIAETFGNGILLGIQAASGLVKEGAEGLFGLAILTLKGKMGLAKLAGAETALNFSLGLKEGGNKLLNPLKGLSQEKQALYNLNLSTINTLSPITDNITARAASVLLLNQGAISLAQYGKILREGAAAIAEVNRELTLENANIAKTASTAGLSAEKTAGFFLLHAAQIGTSLLTIGSAIHMASMLIDTSSEGGKKLSGTFMTIGGAAILAGVGIKAFSGALNSIPWMAIVSGIFAVINGISTFISTPEEELKDLEERAEELNNLAKEAKANYRTLSDSAKKIDELKEKRYESTEAAEEYQDAVEDLASKFPELITGFDEAGNAILSNSSLEAVLTSAREKSAKATYDAIEAEVERSKKELEIKKLKLKTDFLSLGNGDNKIVVGYSENELPINYDKLNDFSLKYNATEAEVTDFPDVERIILNAAKEMQLEFRWSDYLEQVYNEDTGLYDYSLSTYLQFIKSQSNISEEMLEILDIFNNTSYDKNLDKVAAVDAAIDKFNASTDENLIENYNSLMNLLRELLSTEEGINTFGDRYNSIYKLLEDLSKDIDEVNAAEATTRVFSKQLISTWQKKQYSMLTFLEDSNALVEFTTNAINSTVSSDYQNDFNKYKTAMSGKIPEVSSVAQEFWLGLANQTNENGEELQTIFNKMAADSRYTGEDIVTYFSQYGLTDQRLINAIINSYAESAGVIKDNIVKNIILNLNKITSSNLENLLTYIEGKDTQFTKQDQTYFTELVSLVYNLEKNGFTKDAEIIALSGEELFTLVSSYGPTLSAAIFDIILKNGITTKEGIEESIKSIENIPELEKDEKWELIKDYFTNLYSGVFANLSLSVNSTMDKFLADWEDVEKDISKLTSGVSIAEAGTFVEKAKAFDNFSLSLSDFKTNGDKLVLSTTQASAYLEAYLSSITADIKSYSDTLDNYSKLLTKDEKGNLVASLSNKFTQLNLKDMGISQAIISKVTVDAEGYITNSDEIAELILKDQQTITTLISNANILLQWAKNILNNSKWKNGDYSSLAADLGSDWENIFKNALKNGVTQELKEATPDLKNATDKAQSALNSLISDILSKGFENINLADYEGLYDIGIEDLKGISYKDFVKKYAELTGQTIDEINDLMVLAYKKDNERTSGAAKDALKDVTFYKEELAYASLDTINELAKIFDIPAQNIIGQYNELLGGYLVNLDNIDLSTIDDFAQLVKESINGIIKNIIGFASSAISGKLSQQDKLNFNALLDALGLSTIGDIDFVETVDGLKMSLAAATNLYNELKHVDRILALLLFNDLNKSLQETNEHYKSISDIANRIKEIESIPSNARTNQYEQELALAKEIYAVRSTTEDSSFSFMSNKIPGAQNNPINYFNNWAKAIHTFNDALKTQGTYTRNGETFESGFVDYDFWYNLVTEMNNIARVSGTKISFAGKELNGDLTTAAELIEAGAASLVATDTGEIKVALSGMSLNFESGADAFSGGVTEGIQELAKSQSEMLDGMIQLLETVVAMEKLGDITGENDTIDITDLFPDIAWKEGEKRAIDNEKAINWINNELLAASDDSAIGKFINSVLVNNQKLRDVLTDAVNQSEGINVETAEALSALLNSLWQMSLSNEYDLDSLFASLQLVAKTSDLNMTIPMGDSTLLIEHGAIIVLTKEGKFETPDGTSYGSSAEAFAASMMTALGIDVKGNSYHFDAETGTAVGTLELGSTIFTVTRDSNGKVTYKGKNGVTGASLEEYIHNYAVKDVDHGAHATVEEIELLLQLEYGVKQLDSFTYKSIKDDIKLQLEEALASGDLTKVDAVIEANPILSLLKGLTGEEIAKLLHLDNINVSVENTEALNAINVIEEELKKIEDNTITIKADISQVKTAIDEAKEYASKTKALQAIDLGGNVLPGQIKENVKTAKSSKALQSVEAGGNNVPGVINYNITYAEEHPAKQRVEASGNGVVQAVGNIGLATGNALARGTLMGELGPELVVSKGRYFVVGQAGPEMVNLADDAIVFNHLQTESLLKKGMSKGRGKAITNERNAVSFATGNVNGGPAKASASAALAALRQLKAQWDALAGLSAKDLAGKGGGGGGGGGDPKAFLKDLERWYDWLQQIAQLEKEISLEEAKRAKYQSDMVARGKEYFTSQMASLEKLQEQAVVLQSLNDSLEEYFLKRLKELNEQSAFSALYGFSESGQLYYKDVYADGKSAFEWLSDLVGRDEVTGEANYTAEEQYNKLVEAGFGFAMQYDSAGNEIKHEGEDWYNTALQAFWDKIDRDKEEMQSLHDSVEDGKKKLYELETAQNEILHEIEDNLIAVEQKVLKAIEEARQREIDELKDTKAAIENSAKEFTDGLNKQLDKERQMRDNQANADELASLLRRLSILQRSGGSASEIRDLLQLINDKQYDKYFDMQEQLIQAIQDSSDAQIERLDNLILLMEETLAYEKENGLLWVDVDDILKQSSEDIVSFILGNTSEYWSKSTTELLKVLREDLFEVDRFKQFLETVEEGMDALIEKYGTEELKKALADKKRAEAAAADAATGAANAENTTTTTTTTSGSSSQEQKQLKYKATFTNHAGGRTDAYSVTSKEDAIKKALDYIRNSYAELQKKHPGMPQAGLGDAMRADLASIKAILYYSTGGYDYTTGLAMLHGTKTRPEGIFNAEQTRILREQFLSNRPDSVISLLKDYRDAYHGLSSNTYDSIQNNSNAMTIEHAEVNLNVDKLANDYDAKQAANTVMDEMLRIASKTKSNNSVRR